MWNTIGGRKMSLTIIGIVMITVVTMTQDIETIKWFGGLIATIVTGYNIANGIKR